MSDGLRKAYGFSDVCIVTKDDACLFAHLPILTLSAPKFARMLHERRSENRGGNVLINDFDGDVVEEFLRGLYNQEPRYKFTEVSDVSFTTTLFQRQPLLLSGGQPRIRYGVQLRSGQVGR